MGKSPGKWIKTVLFGKKSSKSNASKGREKLVNEKGVLVAAKSSEADATPVPPVVSHPIPAIAGRNERTLELNNMEAVDISHNEGALLQGSQDVDSQGSTPQDAPYDPEKEKAATKAQAAFRGYLARRAFKALKGIIRLQALIRAHLVRRQAVATLYCMLGVVKLQAVARGRKVRLSDTGLEVQKICSIMRPMDGQLVDSVGVTKLMCMAKLSSNALVCKLLASSPTVMPLRLHYDPGEPSSVQNWLERWSASHFWKPVLQPKKVSDLKSRRKQGQGQPAEPETGRPKRSVRRVPAANLEPASVQSIPELEKPKRSLRKVLSHPAEPVQENPQNELEKVKRSLRKVHNPIVENSVQSEAETEKPRQNLEKVSSTLVHDVTERSMSNSGEKMKKETILTECGICNSAEKVKKDTSLIEAKLPEVETTPGLLETNEELDLLCDNDSVAESKHLMERNGKDENSPETNGDLSHKDDLTSNENQKSNRKVNTPAKPEHAENGHQHSPTLPSYMAATESAKAKLRLQGSPRFGQDGSQKNNNSRRHSLPSLTNSKISSQSPRTQRLVNASAKGGNKSDRSLSSSKDGNAKVTPEWRR